MIILSKKTNLKQHISRDDWNKIVERNAAKNFTIIDNTDDNIKNATTMTPIVIKEFIESKIKKVKEENKKTIKKIK